MYIRVYTSKNFEGSCVIGLCTSAHTAVVFRQNKKDRKKNRENNISVVRWSEFVENHICTYSLRVILPSKAVLRVVYDLVKDISYRYLVPGKVGT